YEGADLGEGLSESGVTGNLDAGCRPPRLLRPVRHVDLHHRPPKSKAVRVLSLPLDRRLGPGFCARPVVGWSPGRETRRTGQGTRWLTQGGGANRSGGRSSNSADSSSGPTARLWDGATGTAHPRSVSVSEAGRT